MSPISWVRIRTSAQGQNVSCKVTGFRYSILEEAYVAFLVGPDGGSSVNNPSVIKDQTLTRFEVVLVSPKNEARCRGDRVQSAQFRQRLSEYLGTGLDPGPYSESVPVHLPQWSESGRHCVRRWSSAFALRCDNGSWEITG